MPPDAPNAPRRGHRRRLLERLSRISSSPQLHALHAAAAPARLSASCVSLAGSGSGSGVRVVDTVDIPYGSGGASLRIRVPRRQPRRDLWTGLPDEVKVGVLGWLDPRELVRCSAVSKHWHSLCFDGQLWSTLDATAYYDKIPVDQLAKIVTTAGPFVKYLNLRGCIQLTNDWRTEAVWNAPRNLLAATLEGCALSRASLQFLVIRNPALAHLNLSGLATVTNSILRLIAQSCPNLASLNVSWCANADARGLKKIVDACKQLRDLRACEIDRFDDTAITTSLWRANSLEHLHLSACPGLSDDAISTLVLGPDPEIDPFTNRPLAPPRKLVHLNLSRCSRLTDSALRSLADNVPVLEGLELAGCTALTDAGFAALLPTLGRLSHLDVEECAELTNATLIALARGPAAKRMRSLGVSYCENVGDGGIVEVVRKCTALGNLEMDNTRISDLALTEAAHAVRYRPANPSARPHPAAHSPRIALRLVVYDCAAVTWSGVRGIMARNVESASHPPPPPPSSSSSTKPDLIQLKCFYGWQPTVDAHTARVLRGDPASLASANRLESKWAEHMGGGGAEDGGIGRRRRRRAREAALLFGDEDEDFGFGFGAAGGGGARRRSGRGACVVS